MIKMKKNAIRLAVASALAVALAAPAIAASPPNAEARVKWTASVLKKSDVSLNVFSEGNTALDFHWNISDNAFSSQDRTLTVQAAGYDKGTGYNIKAQVTRDTLNAAQGGVKDTLKVAVELGGIPLTNGLTDILRGTTGAVDPQIAANGLQHMNLSKTGPNTTPKGAYHEARGVPVKFAITSGTDNAGAQIDAGNLQKIADGKYSGDVELRFVASWEAPLL
ncbi:common pilus major fimbrillin subunit EcpA [Burkholderia diffusa]|uniref:common pilus major fimbrillin subunit EcpA n=1 Tax=Burkholderia diffusa TaxID=488732 RepID=UPI0012D979A0|nr:common pilus major fimbrillin subunit EcpA [Burkholderia diffusa]